MLAKKKKRFVITKKSDVGIHYWRSWSKYWLKSKYELAEITIYE